MLSEGDNIKSSSKPISVHEKAVPIECGHYSAIGVKPNLSAKDASLSPDDGLVKLNVEQSVSSGDTSSEMTPRDRKSISAAAQSPQQWHYENAQDRKASEDEDRPPSPTPLQGRERMLQSRMYTPSGPVSLSGFQDPALLASSFGHEDLGAGSVSKHVH